MQDKMPRNAEGQPHGYWESYWSNGKLYYKGLYLKGLEEGLWEEYWSNGKLWFKGNFIKGQRIGYIQLYNLDGSIKQTRFYAR